MNARTQLAALDNNNNCSRKQAVVKQGSSKGSLRYNLVFPKIRKTWVVRPIKEVKDYSYVNVMMENILKYEKPKRKKKPERARKSFQKMLHPRKNRTRQQLLKVTLAGFRITLKWAFKQANPQHH